LLANDTNDNLTYAGNIVTGNPMLSATTAASQSIPNATSTIVVYGSVDVDTDSAYNSSTGRYTVPATKGGHYTICAACAFTAALTGLTALSIAVNASTSRTYQLSGTSANQVLLSCATLNLAGGAIIDARVVQNSGGASTLAAAGNLNYLSIKREAS